MTARASAVVLVITLIAGAAACGAETATAPAPDDIVVTTTTSPGTTATTATTTADPDTTVTTSSSTTTTTVTTTTTTTTTATAAAPTTTEAPRPSSEQAVILIGSAGDFPLLPLGRWDGEAWRDAADGVPLEHEGPAVLTSVLVGTVETVLSQPSTDTDEFGGEVCFDGRTGLAADTWLAGSDVPGFGYSSLAVMAPWDVVPRDATLLEVDLGELPSDDPIDVDVDAMRVAGARLVDARGGDGSAGEVSQIVRVDLDGDGTDELLVTFEHVQPSFLGAPGDFSIVFVRSLSGDEPDDRILVEWLVDPASDDDIATPVLFRSRVLAVADLDGNGHLEVAIHRWYYEGAGVEIVRVGEQAVETVLVDGCGA